MALAFKYSYCRLYEHPRQEYTQNLIYAIDKSLNRVWTDNITTLEYALYTTFIEDYLGINWNCTWMTLTQHIFYQGGINTAGNIRELIQPFILAAKLDSSLHLRCT